MNDTGTTISLSIVVSLDLSPAFDVFVEELAAALARAGVRFETGPDGRIVEGVTEVGRVVSWERGDRFLLQWHPATWAPGAVTEVEVRVEPVEAGTLITMEHRGWGGPLIGDPGEITGWFAGEAVGPLLRATGPGALGDWLTDRLARRPTGGQARAIYRDPLYHYPNFRVILAELALNSQDYLLEVGCGGGAFLKDALRSGCRARAVDHSPEMVRLAREENRDAVAKGRLEVLEASADRLPFPDSTFTCAAMTGVLGFLPDPVAALGEIRRVLRPNARLVILGSDPENRGTPAAPEPMAARLRFYDSAGLKRLADDAGLQQARVVLRDLEPYAREVGVPEEDLPLFAGARTRFLIARKGPLGA